MMTGVTQLPAIANQQSRRLTTKLHNFVDRNFAVVFPAPAVVIVTLLMLYPLFYTLVMSGRAYDLTLKNYDSVGVAHYLVLLKDVRFRGAFVRSFYFSAMSTAASLLVGMVMALILNREFRGSSVIRTFTLIPMVATPAATSLVWMMMMSPAIGVLNYLLKLAGLPPSLWVADRKLALPVIAMIDTWHNAPFVMLILLAGLRALPKEPFEAALIDGASAWQSFIYITFPLIKPALVVALMFRSIDTIKIFDLLYLMTQGGPGYSTETLYLFSYAEAFRYLDLGYGAASIVLLMAIVCVVSVIWIRLRERAWV